MKKRIISMVLALVLTLSLLPAPVFAYVGGIKAPMTQWAQPVVTRLEGSNQGSQIWSMKLKDSSGSPSGEGIEFYLAINGPHAGKSVTGSARYHHNAYMMDSIDLGVYEQARFTLQTGKTQKELKLEKMEVIDPKTEPGFDNYFGYEVPSEGALTVRCTFSGPSSGDPEITCYVSYHIVRLGDGLPDGELSELDQAWKDAEDPAKSHTYAVVARAAWGPGGIATDNNPNFVLRYFQDYHGFSRMGHARAEENSAHVLLSRSYSEIVEADGPIIHRSTSTDITAGLGRTKASGRVNSGEIAEIHSDSYGVDNPFVLADYEVVWDANGGIKPALYMSYDAKADCLSTEAGTTTVGKDGDPYARAMHVWGFRDVYGKNEGAVEDPKFTEPDAVTIPQDADKLALYASEDGPVVAALTDDVIAAKFKKQYGDPLYTLRGNFEAKTDTAGKYYEFTDQKLALTSTITATWSDGDYFRVRVDKNSLLDRFDTTTMVQYSTPGFKLYSAANKADPPAELTLEDDVLALSMDPEKNAVLVFIDIPDVTSRITTAQLKPDGSLILSGQMGLDLIFNCDSDALVTLEALGYGPQKKADGTIAFQQNGIAASGKIDTGSLLGLDLAGIEANINTFQGQELYDFSLELNAFDLFETEAELELKRLNNGRLAPNKLYFFLAAQPGVPIAPPVPTAFLRGGGGGFDGLADTINGDYIAIPPIRLKLTAAGDYLKVLRGRVHLTLGPSYLEYAGTDIELAGADVVDEFKMYLRLAGEKCSYLGTTYTGVRAGGGMGLVLKAPQGDKAIFEVDSDLEASMYGGLDNYKSPTRAYLQIDSRGHISARVMIPQKIGRIDMGRIGGKTLANADADFILGGQTAIDVTGGIGEATRSAFNNLSIYGGVSHTGNFLLTHWRVYYVIPDHVGGRFHLFRNINAGWSLEDEIEKNAWYVSGKPQSYSMSQSWMEDSYACIDDETGEQVGIAVAEASLLQLPADVQEHSFVQTYAGSVTKDVTSPAVPGADHLILQIFPANGGTLDDLEDSLTVLLPDGSELQLEYAEVNAAGEFTNPGTANCTEIEVDGMPGLFIAMELDATTAHTLNFTADCDFSCNFAASAQPTTLELSLINSAEAVASIQNPRDGRTYAVRYYLDTEADRSGAYYFLEMDEAAPYSVAVPATGTLAPTDDYYVTAVLVEKIVGDFNGDGTVSEEEYSWVTVDTQTSDSTVHYTNNTLPTAPTNVALAATGNETLTASWTPVADADAYRVTLYYQDGNDWKRAGASYELKNADFTARTDPAAAKASDGSLTLRMAPTVSGTGLTVSGSTENPSLSTAGGTSDEAPTDTNYKVAVESIRFEQDAANVQELLDVRYYSAAVESTERYLSAYTAPEITVTTENGQRITLNGENGYDTLVWNALPTGALFTVAGSGLTGLSILPDQGSGTFTVADDNGTFTVTAEADAAALLENSGRVKLRVSCGADATDYYLRLTLDTVAPILTLDSSNIAAKTKNGSYTVTGTTEPGLTVALVTNAEAEPVETITATADETGRFTLTGKLAENTTPVFDADGNEIQITDGFAALVSEVTTQDPAGNTADPAPLVVSVVANIPAPTPNPNPSTSGASRANQKGAQARKNPFRDVSSDSYYYEAVLWATENGVTDGITSTLFGPDNICTRAQIVTFLWRALGSPKPETNVHPFTDVPGNAYYVDALLWATENRFVKGTSATTFSPDAPCARAQAVTFLFRAIGAQATADPPFTDVADGTYYAQAVQWAAQNGITNGVTKQRFGPNLHCTRAQIITMLYRVFKDVS